MSTLTMPLGCVLFDLDGTLLDTAPIGAAVNHVLISEGFAPLSDDIIRQTTPRGARAAQGRSWGRAARAGRHPPSHRPARLLRRQPLRRHPPL
jgi:phosphoglycolate phosphatase-like HAD superfamily hydrolase